MQVAELHIVVSKGASNAVVGAYSDPHHAALMAQLFGSGAKVKAVPANAVPDAARSVQLNAIPDGLRNAAKDRGIALPVHF